MYDITYGILQTLARLEKTVVTHLVDIAEAAAASVDCLVADHVTPVLTWGSRRRSSP
jgi:hypothetical protein